MSELDQQYASMGLCQKCGRELERTGRCVHCTPFTAMERIAALEARVTVLEQKEDGK